MGAAARRPSGSQFRYCGADLAAGWLEAVLFAAFAVLAVLFIARYLLETKGLALKDVVAGFERQAAGAKASA